MRSRTTRRDFLRMMGAAAGVAVGAALPGIFHRKGGLFRVVLAVTSGAAAGSAPAPIRVYSVEKGNYVMTQTVVKTKEEWKKALTPEQYHILREKGTERAFSGKYDQHHDHGLYRCAACDLDLYRSEAKYDSGNRMAQLHAPSPRRTYSPGPTTVCFRSVPRCFAPGAADTWATCSTTGRSRRGSASA